MILDIVFPITPITPITPKPPQNDSKTTPKCLKITPKQRFLLYETTLKYIQKIKNWNSYLLKSVRDNQSLFEEKQ